MKCVQMLSENSLRSLEIVTSAQVATATAFARSGSAAPQGSIVPIQQHAVTEAQITGNPVDWDLRTTVNFLKRKGFVSYAAHCQEEEYTGAMLLEADKEDVDAMPEKNSLKKKAFLRLLMALKKQSS